MNKPVRIVPDKNYDKMFRLQWNDGILSQDMYNLSRANDILRCYDRYVANMSISQRMQGNTYRKDSMKKAS